MTARVRVRFDGNIWLIEEQVLRKAWPLRWLWPAAPLRETGEYRGSAINEPLALAQARLLLRDPVVLGEPE